MSNADSASRWLQRAVESTGKDFDVRLKKKTVDRYKILLDEIESYRSLVVDLVSSKDPNFVVDEKLAPVEDVVDDRLPANPEGSSVQSVSNTVDSVVDGHRVKFEFDRYGVYDVLSYMIEKTDMSEYRSMMCSEVLTWYKCRFVDNKIEDGQVHKFTTNQVPGWMASLVVLFFYHCENDSLIELQQDLQKWVNNVDKGKNPYGVPVWMNVSRLKRLNISDSCVRSVECNWNWFRYRFNSVAEKLDVKSRLDNEMMIKRLKSLDIDV